MNQIGRFLLPILTGGLWLFATAQSSVGKSSTSQTSTLERNILAEMNRVRSNPSGYAVFLRSWRRQFQGKQAKIAPRLFLQTREGTIAVDEAIRAVKKMKPVPQLRWSVGMSRAARDHATYQGQRGLIGHKGKDGSTPFERINRYGRWLRVAGENISYGADSATAVVRDLIVDDGVPDRGHRINMFRADYRVTGIACGFHKTYRTMCVIEYAGGYQEKH